MRKARRRAGGGRADSYSVAHEQLHHALAGYKRIGGDAGRRLCFELAAVLWRFLALHELCVARAAAVRRFELVTSVPSGSIERDEHQPLRRLLADLVEPTRDRYERLLQRTEIEVPARSASEEKYRAARSLNGESILLIDGAPGRRAPTPTARRWRSGQPAREASQRW